ncbi:hypothetical protein [Bacillus paramycoides]|uniref:hypothetical protein n=1 Tax=Bacillus paramycoides TaxID=2026194 RepID=UPI002E1A4D88|nr:hypothetical protein [Bacillus paramycoides]
MLNNSTVLSSFMRGNKAYVTLEIDLSHNDLIRVTHPWGGGISIGDFSIQVSQNRDTYTINLKYGDSPIPIKNLTVTISPGDVCGHIDDTPINIGPLTVMLKNIQACIDTSSGKLCLKAEVYLENVPVVGEKYLGPLNVCPN